MRHEQITVFDNMRIPVAEMEEYLRIDERSIPEKRPYVYFMFVKSVDGIGSMNEPGYHDPMIGMAGPGIAGRHIAEKGVKDAEGAAADWRLLQYGWATADAVIGGSNIIRGEKNIIWRPYDSDLIEYRKGMGKGESPIQVVLTGRGIDRKTMEYPIFNTGGVRTIIATSRNGYDMMKGYKGSSVEFEVFREGRVDINELLPRLRQNYGVRVLDLQGGPTVFGEFLKARVIDELRITQSPLIIGSENSKGERRPGPTERLHFPADMPVVLGKSEVARAGNHYFFRYRKLTYEH